MKGIKDKPRGNKCPYLGDLWIPEGENIIYEEWIEPDWPNIPEWFFEEINEREMETKSI